MKNIFKNKIKYILVISLFFISLFLTTYFYISNYSAKYIYDYKNLESMPYNKVGLVLGTSPVTKDGLENTYFTERLDAAKYLLENKKIDIILISGDNRDVSYNEPKYMRKYLQETGVASTSIISDYAGLRTLDSVLRSDKVFGQKSITVISQRFHNERAVYIAKNFDIDAIAFASDKYKKPLSSEIRMFLRETMTRFGAVYDVIIKREPKFLGEKVDIK